MAGGWARDGAVQDQIDASVEDAVQRARSKLPSGESLRNCEECETRFPKPAGRLFPVCVCVLPARHWSTRTKPAPRAITVGAARTASFDNQR